MRLPLLNLLVQYDCTLKICLFWLTVIALSVVGTMLMQCGPNSKNCHRRPKSWLKVAWLLRVHCLIVAN